jgi:hypothetical protein
MRVSPTIRPAHIIVAVLAAVVLVSLPPTSALADCASPTYWVVQNDVQSQLPDCIDDIQTDGEPLFEGDNRCNETVSFTPMNCTKVNCDGQGRSIPPEDDFVILHAFDLGLDRDEGVEFGTTITADVGWSLGSQEGVLELELKHVDDQDECIDGGCGCHAGSTHPDLPLTPIAALLLAATGLTTTRRP